MITVRKHELESIAVIIKEARKGFFVAIVFVKR